MSELKAVVSKEVDVERQSPSPAPSTHKQEPIVQRPSPLIWGIVVASIFLGGFLYGLDTTIAADVQASVYEEFKDIEKLAWVGIGFPMGSVSIILLTGVCFGLFNTKWMMIGFFAAFEAGSALCGGAPNIDALIVGRVLAGMGGAGIYIGALTYFSTFTTVKERPLYNAGIGLCWGVGAILGPVIGGAFSVNQSTTWRWAFYINLPLAGALAPAYVFCFPSHNPRPELTVRAKFAMIDWIGAVLNACTFVFFIVAVTFSGSSWTWSSGGTIAMWVLFGVSVIAFAVQQGSTLGTSPSNRLLPVHLLKSRTMILLFFVTAASSTAAGITIYYIPLFFQFTKGDSALRAAVRLLPFIVPYVFAMMFNGALLPVTKRYAPWYLFGGIAILVASSLMHEISPSTHTAAIYGFEILLALGAGVTFQIAYAAAAAKLTGYDIPAGIGLFNVAQIGAIAIALTMAGSIFQNVGLINLKHVLASYNLPEDVLRAALAGAQSAVSGVFDAKMSELVVQAVVKTVSTEFILVMTSGALMTVSAVLMRWEKLNMEAAAGA